MKVLLVYPNIVESPKDMSIGLGIISAMLKEKGHKVELIDTTFKVSDDEIIDKVDQFNPDLVAVTAATNDLQNAIRISQIIKETKEVPIICGGYHATVAPKDIIALLKRSKEALNTDGRVYIVEPFWDRQTHEIGSYCLINTSPYFSALANGTSKMYRAIEMEKFVNEAGLEVEEEINGLGFGHTLMICKVKK